MIARRARAVAVDSVADESQKLVVPSRVDRNRRSGSRRPERPVASGDAGESLRPERPVAIDDPGTAAARRPWAGSLHLWSGRALYLGPAHDTSEHAHHAAQLVIALDSRFTLALPPRLPREYQAALIAPDVSHRLDARGAEVAILYLDAELSAARAVVGTAKMLDLDEEPAVTVFRRGLPAAAGSSDPLSDLCAVLVTALAGSPNAANAPAASSSRVPLPAAGAKPPTRDPRVLRVLPWLESRPSAHVTLADAARHAGISPSRFAHVFRAHTGLPLRRYLLWLRLRYALRRLAEGASTTETAHEAGFSDAAHFARTMRRMFGIAPSQLIAWREFAARGAAR